MLRESAQPRPALAAALLIARVLGAAASIWGLVRAVRAQTAARESAPESDETRVAHRGDPLTEVVVPEPLLWSDGLSLYVREGALLPGFCVRCGAAAGGVTERLSFTLRWHHPAVYVALLLPPVYKILAWYFTRLLKIIRIEDGVAWLSGIHDAVLRAVPEGDAPY